MLFDFLSIIVMREKMAIFKGCLDIYISISFLFIIFYSNINCMDSFVHSSCDVKTSNVQLPHALTLHTQDIFRLHRNLLIIPGRGETEISDLTPCKDTMLKALRAGNTYILTQENFWRHIIWLDQSKFGNLGSTLECFAQSWDVYSVPENTLLLFIPRNQIGTGNTHKQLVPRNIDRIDAGLKLDSLRRIANAFSSETFLKKSLIGDCAITPLILQKIFVNKEDQIPEYSTVIWDIFFFNHGSEDDVVGIDYEAFRDLLIFFNEKITTNLLVYDSCHSGSLKNRTIPFTDTTGTPLALNYTVINPATHAGPNCLTFDFDKINSFAMETLTQNDLKLKVAPMFFSGDSDTTTCVFSHSSSGPWVRTTQVVNLNQNSIPFVRWPHSAGFELLSEKGIHLLTAENSHEKADGLIDGFVYISGRIKAIISRTNIIKKLMILYQCMPTFINASGQKNVFIENLCFVSKQDINLTDIRDYLFDSLNSLDSVSTYYIRNLYQLINSPEKTKVGVKNIFTHVTIKTKKDFKYCQQTGKFDYAKKISALCQSEKTVKILKKAEIFGLLAKARKNKTLLDMECKRAVLSVIGVMGVTIVGLYAYIKFLMSNFSFFHKAFIEMDFVNARPTMKFLSSIEVFSLLASVGILVSLGGWLLTKKLPRTTGYRRSIRPESEEKTLEGTEQEKYIRKFNQKYALAQQLKMD